jgi:sulfide:quinone oxidoreductase
VAGLPTSKTAGAARGEAPVTVTVTLANLLSFLEGRPLTAHCDGYTVCPLITGHSNVVMAEFGYSQQPISSFLIDPTRERWSMWLMKTRMLPWLYWNRMIKGLPHESRCLRPFQPGSSSSAMSESVPLGSPSPADDPLPLCRCLGPGPAP